MKAPDKIYIQDGLPNIYGVNQDSGIRGMHEYIRKDALLEWAKEELGNTSILRSETIEVLQKVINKLSST